MQRVTVALRNKNGKFTVPKFSDCLLEFFGKDVNSVNVKFSLENGILVLSESEEGHELSHSPVCPIKLSADTLNKTKEQSSKVPNVGLAASVAIESSDSHVLLTKRSAHMKASPNVWVLPGGHIEPGETVFEAGTREVKEETALDITNEKASVLGLWENVYPLSLGVGVPKYHTLVIYLHTHLNQTYDEITKNIIPDPKEVSAFCWLNISVLHKLFSGDEDIKSDGKQYTFENEKIVEKYLDYNTMFNKWLRIQPQAHSGANYGLRKWMKKVSSKNANSKY